MALKEEMEEMLGQDVVRPEGGMGKELTCPCGWHGSDELLAVGKIDEESRYCLCCPECGRIYWDDRFLERRGF